MSARGHSREYVADVPYGTVASYLMTHCSVPMLVLPTTVRPAQTSLPTVHERLRLPVGGLGRSEEHTSELQSLMRISYAVFCLKQKKNKTHHHTQHQEPKIH